MASFSTKSCLRIVYCFNLIVLIYSSESAKENVEEGQIYHLSEVFKKSAILYKNSFEFIDISPLYEVKSGGFDENFEFQPTGTELQNSLECLDDIIYTFENLKDLRNLKDSNKQWAFKMIDSFGKPESGFLQGNFHWIGDYNECMEVQVSNPNASSSGHFRGQYCTVVVPLNSSESLMPFQLTIGICVPDSCKAKELEGDVQQLLHIAGIVLKLNETQNVTVTCKPLERHLDTSAKGVISLLSIFLALALIGSSITTVKYIREVLDGYKNPSLALNIYDSYGIVGDQNDLSPRMKADEIALLQDNFSTTNEWLRKLEAFFSCFCVFKNGAKLLNTDTSEGELLCIHGIRFLSMSWVILGHTYVFGIQQIKNMFDVLKYIDTFLFEIVLQGFYSVDSFFVLSGFLLAYLSMKEFAKTKGSILWPYFYIHRYIRLTPIYMVILGFYTTVFLYLGSGPYWPDYVVDKNCKQNWWKNLIYINNFDGETDQCMMWAWYLANDMQFFVISPLFLISLWRWPKIGYFLISAALIACWLTNFIITYHFDLISGMLNIHQMALTFSKQMDYFNKLYTKPYARIAPYLIGMLTGYHLFKKKASNKPKHGLVFLSVGWILSSAIALSCIFATYHSNPSTVANSFYNALSRTGFALGVAWVIYVCLIGQGGPVNAILSYKLFIPLSRLTYAAYLIHPMVISAYFSSLTTNIEFNHVTMVFCFISFLVVTYGLSLPVALILESPIVSLEKLVQKCFGKKQNIESVN